METYYNGMIEKDTSVVSEELNSVETWLYDHCFAYFAMFQKDLIVWKRFTPLRSGTLTIEFQKDLIVWKLNFLVSYPVGTVCFRRT